MLFFNDDIEKRRNEIVLGKEGKPIAIFVKGEFETDDPEIIAELKDKGYDFKEDKPKRAKGK